MKYLKYYVGLSLRFLFWISVPTAADYEAEANQIF